MIDTSQIILGKLFDTIYNGIVDKCSYVKDWPIVIAGRTAVVSNNYTHINYKYIMMVQKVPQRTMSVFLKDGNINVVYCYDNNVEQFRNSCKLADPKSIEKIIKWSVECLMDWDGNHAHQLGR